MVLDISDKRWAQKAVGLQLKQLDSVRANAEQWRNGLAALTALLTAVTIIKGPDTVDGLSDPGRHRLVVLLGTGFVSLLVGTFCAMRAAFGTPHKLRFTGEDLRGFEEKEIGLAKNYMRASRGLMLLGVILVAAATGNILVDRKPTTKALLQVTRSDKVQMCGELLSVDRSGLYLQQQGNANRKPAPLVIPVTAIKGIKVVAACTP